MWVPDQFNIPMNPSMMPQLPPPLLPLGIPMGPIGEPEWNANSVPSGPGNNFIGPIPPEDQDTTMDLTQDEESKSGQGGYDNERGESGQGRGKQGSNRESRWNRNRDRDNKDNNRQVRQDRNDRGHRPRSQDRNRDRSDRSRSDRNNRDRVSRFDSRDKPPKMPGLEGHGGPSRPGNNVMMPGMMPFGNNMMGPGPNQLDLHKMPNNMMQGNIPNNMMQGNMSNNMMQGIMPNNMMPGNMMGNMMMAQHQMQMMGQQPIYFQGGVLLTPIPGVSMTPRRERPVGCRTIFVGGLPPGIGLDVITEIFQRFGSIDDIKMHKQGVCHIRFGKSEMVDQSFMLSGYRFKTHDQGENEATTLFIDYALNREDQSEQEKQKREPTPPRIEPFSPAALTTLTEKIKSDIDFAESAPTLAGWLEKGECNKKNANTFYSLIQACNSQVRRLYNEKMGVDEEFFEMKTSMKEKFAHIIIQFEQVAKILSAAKHKRASDHFTKQQRRNIEMWLKMTEDLENIKEEFNTLFDDEEIEKIGQKLVPAEKYEQLKAEIDTLICELEGYRNEAHLAKDEAERKFEKFKAQFIAQQALHGNRQQQGGIFPPLPPPPPMPSLENMPLPPNDEQQQKQEAKVLSMLTAFLLAHPLGATLDYLTSYVRSLVPDVPQISVITVLLKNTEIFNRNKDRWTYVLFDIVKKEGK